MWNHLLDNINVVWGSQTDDNSEDYTLKHHNNITKVTHQVGCGWCGLVIQQGVTLHKCPGLFWQTVYFFLSSVSEYLTVKSDNLVRLLTVRLDGPWAAHFCTQEHTCHQFFFFLLTAEVGILWGQMRMDASRS